MIWMRMEKDFMKKHYISLMRNEKDGNDVFALYMTMLTESIDHDGELRSADGVPFTNQTLLLLAFRDCIRPDTAAKDMKRFTEVVERGLPLFQRLGLIEIDQEGTIHMLKLADKIGVTSTERSRKHREKKKQEETPTQHNATLQSVAGNDDMQRKCNEVRVESKELELKSELKQEEDKKESDEKPVPPPHFIPDFDQVYSFVRMTKYTFKDEKTGLDVKEDYIMDPKQYYEHVSSNGWRTGSGKPITDWKASIRAWEARERKYKREKKKSDKPDVEIPWLADYIANLK